MYMGRERTTLIMKEMEDKLSWRIAAGNECYRPASREELKSIGVALMRERPLRVIAESSSSLFSLFFSVYISTWEFEFQQKNKLLFCVYVE